eukprot:4080177-Amphidinium_carterae.1
MSSDHRHSSLRELERLPECMRPPETVVSTATRLESRGRLCVRGWKSSSICMGLSRTNQRRERCSSRAQKRSIGGRLHQRRSVLFWNREAQTRVSGRGC